VRIIHFVENLERGGLERAVIDLVRAQTEAGHECSVVCLFDQGLLANELVADGVRVDACGKKQGLDLGCIGRARGLLKKAPGAVLHTHNATAHYHAVLASIGLPLRRIVNTRHGMGEAKSAGRGEWLYRHSMQRTDYVVAVCEAARRRFELGGVRPRIGMLSIPNGIRLEGFAATSPQARNAMVAELGFAEGTRVIGTVGRLEPVKDQASLIRAFRHVHGQLPDTALVIVGDGSQRKILEAEAATLGITDAVRFLGDRDDVARLLQGMDLFALSSLSEGYSIALLEACAAGLPIVATAVGGNAEIVRDGVNGKLVPAGDVLALAASITNVLQSPGRVASMGDAGRSWVLREGSFTTMSGRYLELYASTGARPEQRHGL
jgi:glycosyltransferase involved in cell wall biosynthesis